MLTSTDTMLLELSAHPEHTETPQATRQRIAEAIHAEECHFCRLGSPMCDGQPTRTQIMRAAEFQAVAAILTGAPYAQV